MPRENYGIPKRLREFRKSFPGISSKKDFSKAIGVDKQRLSAYEHGAKLPSTAIRALMQAGVNPYWLLFGQGKMRAHSNADELKKKSIYVTNTRDMEVSDMQMSEFYILPLYSDEVAAGEPLEVRDTEIEGPAIVHCSWCPHPDDTECVRVSSTGTSMEPTIPAGSIVTIDRTQNEPEKLLGEIVAIAKREGGVTLKRLQKDGRKRYVGVPDNIKEGHSVIHIDEGDRVVGVVQTVHTRLY